MCSRETQQRCCTAAAETGNCVIIMHLSDAPSSHPTVNLGWLGSVVVKAS